MLSSHRTAVVYGLAIAAGAFALQWLETRYATGLYSTEFYIAVLAMLFAGFGIWIGLRLAHRPRDPEFEKNERVIRTLGLTPKELEVLEHLVQGGTNKEIAERLFVSPSTIKSHLVHLYQKLGVSRRTQAIQKARSLQIIP